MTRLLIFSLTLIFTLGSLGCIGKRQGSSLVSQNPEKRNEEQANPLWKITLSSTCTNDGADQCLAGYGFSILQNGKYEVGPGPQGQIYSQMLDSNEFQLISEVVTKFLSTTLEENESGEICVPRVQSESKDTLMISYLGKEKNVLRTSEIESCFKTKAVDDAGAMHNAILDLAKKYYSLPFPDSCRNIAAETETLYPSVTSCLKDSDCSYLDPNYLPITTGERRYITTDDCTVLKPLSVANSALTLKARAQLLSSKRRTIEACGTLLVRVGCSGIGGFYSGENGPVCVSGSCQINPSISGL